MKALVILPTYNEAGNIEAIIEQLLHFPFLDLLVVDDHSEDGTGERVGRWMAHTDRVFLLQKEKRFGLGSAYVSGFRWGLEREYDYFFEMDADLSHDPLEIPSFINKCKEGYEMVVGSRCLDHKINVVGWDFRRLLLSKFGNYYIQKLTPLKSFTDTTSGYRCYTRKALEELDLSRVRSNGYAFQVEMAYRAYQNGLRIAEIPIIFYERNYGRSKMNGKIIWEAVLAPFRWRVERMKLMPMTFRTVLKCLHHPFRKTEPKFPTSVS